jgi:hypothetical protein
MVVAEEEEAVKLEEVDSARVIKGELINNRILVRLLVGQQILRLPSARTLIWVR